MSAPTTQQPSQQSQAQQLSDAQTLELALERSKQRVAELERDKRESELLSGIVFKHDGLEASNLASLWRLATMYSRSDIVPEQFRGKPENCLIALQMAQRCRIDPFAFMQSSYIVHGRPGIEAKLAIAMLNASGNITGRVRYEFSGSGATRACTACVKDKGGEEIRLTLDWKTVEAEGWSKKNGSKWLTIPDQMFRYRSATFLIRAHYPEVMMGLRTTEEMEDMAEEPAASGPPVGRGITLGRNGGAPKENGHEDKPASSPVHRGTVTPTAEAAAAPAGEPAPVPEAGPAGDAAQGPDQEMNSDDAMAQRDAIDEARDKMRSATTDRELSEVSAWMVRNQAMLGDHYDDMVAELKVRTGELQRQKPAVAGKVGGKSREF